MAAKGLGRGLGKGLDGLIPKSVDDNNVKKEPVKIEENTGEKISLVKITMVEPNRNQPRQTFNDDSLKELADSISNVGLIQPIVVLAKHDDKADQDYYEIVSGERRWRASKLAGLKEIPVIIKDYTEEERAVISIIENIQREDLNPIDEALAYKKLLTDFNLKQEEVAEKVSKSRAAVTNSMRLLKLADEVQQMVIDEKLNMGQARALLAVDDKKEQVKLAEKIVAEKLNVRDVEKLMKNVGKPAKEKKTKDKTLEAIYQDLEEKLKQQLSTKVTISPKDGGAGKIEIEFYSHEDLDRILDMLNN